MGRKKLSMIRRFNTVLRYVVENEKVRVTELSEELRSKFKLKRSTCVSYASKTLFSLYNLGILERKNRDYVLTPDGWYCIYNFLELAGYPEELSLDVLLERLRKENSRAALFIPALKIFLDVYDSVAPEEEEEELECTYELFEFYVSELIDEKELPFDWDEVISKVIPDLTEVPLSIFLEMLKKKIKGESDIVKAAMKDLIREAAKILEDKASKMEVDIKRLRERAQELKEITDKL